MKDHTNLYTKKEYSVCQKNFTRGQSEKNFQQFEKIRYSTVCAVLRDDEISVWKLESSFSWSQTL